MAWYALYKWFISFRKIPYINWNRWYKKYLYAEWFHSLSEEEQIQEVTRIKEKEKQKESIVILL